MRKTLKETSSATLISFFSLFFSFAVFFRVIPLNLYLPVQESWTCRHSLVTQIITCCPRMSHWQTLTAKKLRASSFLILPFIRQKLPYSVPQTPWCDSIRRSSWRSSYNLAAASIHWVLNVTKQLQLRATPHGRIEDNSSRLKAF